MQNMIQFELDKDKAINAVLYIINRLGPVKYHKLSKILYFAEQEHLKLYGRPITGDQYVAMEYGPVPSYAYDVFKYELSDKLSIQNKTVSALVDPDLEELSVSEINAIEHSIVNNQNLGFQALVDKSHDLAWENSRKLHPQLLDFIDIALAGGADEKMINYIQSSNEKLI
ncbi:MAG: Panacea domain-containing protein [Candidatus Pedobacter colombiensis]|uniref:Panacea domain-containing protein n=1 Tax=Candidatus Pedobacter colombiensis TaxID=3121371 RepID=A0AAJ6B6F1_9SPHI|nr:Panacea domain-containing protein [Pedobacter sp.]WEK18859.1 MAG: Panacea domain-containing protein [Pedobacter sp.]